MHRQVGRTLSIGLLLAGTAMPAALAAGPVERASVGPGGVQGNMQSFLPGLSADGRFVVFGSVATNLVAGDTNGEADVFVRDRQAGTSERVSVGPGGVEANSNSFGSAITADGRFVAFESRAENPVAGDTNGEFDVFVRDRQGGVTERVSVLPGGGQPDGGSFAPAISADGRFVAFLSRATNLVAGDTNGEVDVFVHDRQTGATKRVSVGPGGAQADGQSLPPAISADGLFVAFDSPATNLVADDTNSADDVFVHDLGSGTTRRVSVGPGGVQGTDHSNDPALAPLGRFVTFTSSAVNLVTKDTNRGRPDVFVHDLRTGVTRLVSRRTGGVQGNEFSSEPVISGRGRFVAFTSYASNLVPGDTNEQGDIFVRDRPNGTTVRVNLGPGGAQAQGANSGQPAISADGRVVAFWSEAANLVPGDTNGMGDVFVRVIGP
jgi:Tol biopolymer transport system component